MTPIMEASVMDKRRLAEVTPAQRGFRFVGPMPGRGTVRANVPYLVTAAAVTRHYTSRGALKRVALLRSSGFDAKAWAFAGDKWMKLG